MYRAQSSLLRMRHVGKGEVTDERIDSKSYDAYSETCGMRQPCGKVFVDDDLLSVHTIFPVPRGKSPCYVHSIPTLLPLDQGRDSSSP